MAGTGKRSLVVVWGAFGAAVLAFVAAVTLSAQTSLGWFAYAPLSQGVMLPDLVLMSRTSAALYAVGVLCLLAGAYGLGLRRGRKTGRR